MHMVTCQAVQRATEGAALGTLERLAGLSEDQRGPFWDSLAELPDVPSLLATARTRLCHDIAARVLSGKLRIVCRPN